MPHYCSQLTEQMGKANACALDECNKCQSCGQGVKTQEAGTCGRECPNHFLHGKTAIVIACALDECRGCPQCQAPATSSGVEDGSYIAPSGAGCNALYREKQEGLKCGKHAVNAVLENLGKSRTVEEELDEISRNVGEPSEGDDYDIATLTFLLMNHGLRVQPVGEIASTSKTVTQLLSGIGTADSAEKRFTMSFENLQWLICNVHGHWKTYFITQGQWCDLDSIPAGQNQPPAALDLDAMKNLECRAIIVPIPTA